MQQNDFIELIKKNEGLIYKICNIYTHTKEDQKDLYQEIVYQLFRSFPNFKGRAKISTYIYRVALNTALTYTKNQKRSKNTHSLSSLNLKHEPYDDILEEKLKLMYAQIKQLNDIEKGLIFLFLEGKKYEEISQISGFSVSNVGTRIARIKEKLRLKLNNS